jgi:predicted MFS family arabinose efflux permease
MNVSRLLGPAIAGFVVAALGEGMCFAINAGSYVAVIGALLLIRGDFSPAARRAARARATRAAGGVPEAEAPPPGVFAALKEGVLYAARTTPIRAPILLLAVFGFGGMAYAMLMPVFVKSIGGDANTLGYLSSASALGSVLGTGFLATRKSVVGMGKLALVASFAYAFALLAFGFAHSLWAAVPALVCLGAAMMLQMGCCNTILQSVVDDDKRGRVMSLFTMAFMATIPLGSLAGGAIASRFGFHAMVFACAGWCLLVAIGFASQVPRLRRETRPHYLRRGLITAEDELEVLSHPNS